MNGLMNDNEQSKKLCSHRKCRITRNQRLSNVQNYDNIFNTTIITGYSMSNAKRLFLFLKLFAIGIIHDPVLLFALGFNYLCFTV